MGRQAGERLGRSREYPADLPADAEQHHRVPVRSPGDVAHAPWERAGSLRGRVRALCARTAGDRQGARLLAEELRPRGAHREGRRLRARRKNAARVHERAAGGSGVRAQRACADSFPRAAARCAGHLIYGLLFLFFCVLAFWAARYFSRELRRTRDWPTVPGRILERGVGEPMGTGRTYMPRVRYAYRVDGKEYTGDQVYVIRRTGNLPGAVQKLVDSLPDPVTVHYNPQNPTQTWLIANSWGMFWLLLAVGLLALFLGVGQILVAL